MKNNKNQMSQIENKEGITSKKESLMSVYLRRFKKHKLGNIGFWILVFFYFTAIFADILSPYTMSWMNKKKAYHPPSKMYFMYKGNDKTQFKPFVYEKILTNVAFKEYKIVPQHTMRAISIETSPGKGELRSVFIDKDQATRERKLINAITSHYLIKENHAKIAELSNLIKKIEEQPAEDVTVIFKVGEVEVNGKIQEQKLMLVKGNKNFLSFFSRGVAYSFLNLFNSNIHFFGSDTGGYFPLGGDALGRDLLSRLLHGSRISLSVGLVGVLISFVIGLLIGGLAGYFGGIVDTILMRFSEIMLSFPSIYLLFTLRSSLPQGLPSTQIYLLIIMILALVGWASLARIIRGMVLSLKNEDYVLSAKTVGLSHLKIITKHILPNTLSFIIVQATLTIPGYILGESALSLLGLGITEPQSSWGNMLSVARNHRVLQNFPWVLIPGFTIFLSIMAWNFFGDGVRDAVDPKSKH